MPLQLENAFIKQEELNVVQKLGGWLFHSHKLLDPIGNKKIIMMIRNPYDWIVSKYHYSYKHRKGSQKTLIDALPDMLEQYANYLKNKSSNVKLLYYEDLYEHPFSFMQQLLSWLNYPELGQQTLLTAIHNASVARLKEYEAQTKHAIVANPDKFMFPSFIRGGYIGEGLDLLSSKQTKQIKQFCKGNELPERYIKMVT